MKKLLQGLGIVALVLGVLLLGGLEQGNDLPLAIAAIALGASFLALAESRNE